MINDKIFILRWSNPLKKPISNKVFKLRHYKWICLLLKLPQAQVHFSLGSNLWHAIKCSLSKKKSISIPKELKFKNKVSGFGERVWFRSSWALSRFQRCLELYVRLAGVSTNSISTSHRASVTSAHHSDTLTQRTRAMSTNLPQLDRPTTWGSSHYSIKSGFLERPN